MKDNWILSLEDGWRCDDTLIYGDKLLNRLNLISRSGFRDGGSAAIKARTKLRVAIRSQIKRESASSIFCEPL